MSTSPAAPPAARPAGLLRRLAALAYDALLLLGPIAAYAFLVVLLRHGEAVEPNTLWFTAGVLAIPFVFFGWFWTHGGQTLGMTAWRIRVVSEDGRAIGWTQAALRYAGMWLSLIPAGLGFWWAWLDPDRRAWHDRLARTRVVHIPKTTKLSAP